MSLERVLDEAEGRQLPALIDEWSGIPDERGWLAIALRVDLALLITHPELVIPCLHRRCAHAGEPMELRSAIANWTWTWSEGRTWLRSVRGRHVPLAAGAIEEYRTSEPGALWTDGAHVGVEGGVAWERATGRRVDRGRAPRTPRWQLGTRGDAVTIDGRVFSIGDGETADRLLELDDRLALLAVTEDVYGEYDAYHYLIDVPARRILWRGVGRVHAAALAPDGLLVATPGSLALHDPGSGEELAEWIGVPGDELACAPDGALVTRRGDVIRVWDRARIPATQPTPRSAPLLISPDGDRVLVGEELCDGRTGRSIATIATTGHGSWLENAPPAGAWQLCNAVIAQCLPFGLELWDAFNGEPFLAGDARSADGIDSVAIDAGGHLLAIARSREGTIELSSVRDRTVLHAHPAELGMRPKLGFSLDGSQLWWVDRGGARRAISTMSYARVEPLPVAPGPFSITSRDGLVTLDGHIAVTDDRELLGSPDHQIIVGATTHLVRT